MSTKIGASEISKLSKTLSKLDFFRGKCSEQEKLFNSICLIAIEELASTLQRYKDERADIFKDFCVYTAHPEINQASTIKSLEKAMHDKWTSPFKKILIDQKKTITAHLVTLSNLEDVINAKCCCCTKNTLINIVLTAVTLTLLGIIFYLTIIPKNAVKEYQAIGFFGSSALTPLVTRRFGMPSVNNLIRMLKFEALTAIKKINSFTTMFLDKTIPSTPPEPLTDEPMPESTIGQQEYTVQTYILERGGVTDENAGAIDISFANYSNTLNQINDLTEDLFREYNNMLRSYRRHTTGSSEVTSENAPSLHAKSSPLQLAPVSSALKFDNELSLHLTTEASHKDKVVVLEHDPTQERSSPDVADF